MILVHRVDRAIGEYPTCADDIARTAAREKQGQDGYGYPHEYAKFKFLVVTNRVEL